MPMENAASPPSASTHGKRAARFGAWCLCAFLLAVVLHLTLLARWVPLTGLTAAFLVGAKWLADRRDRSPSPPPYLSSARGLGLALCGLPIGWATYEALLAQVDRLGLGRVLEGGLVVFAMSPMVFFGGGAVGVVVGGLVLAFARPSTSAFVLRGLAAVASTVLAALVIFAGVRLARHPTIDESIGGLQRGSLIEAPGVRLSTSPLASARLAPGAPGTRRDTLGDLTVVRVCEQNGCRLGLVDGPDAPSTPDEIVPGAPHQDWSEELELLRDHGAEAAYLKESSTHHVVAELRRREGRWQPGRFRPEDVLSRASPPVGWVGTGVCGLVAIAFAYWLRHRSRRRWDRLLATGQPGVLDADGRVILEDGRIVQLADGTVIPPGPIVLCAELAQSSAYRERAVVSVDKLVVGTLAEVRERAAFDQIGYDATVCALACLSAAPLVAAACLRLIG